MRTFLPHSLCYHRVRTISLSISVPSSFFLLVFRHNGSTGKTAQLNYFRYPALLKLRIFVEEQCFPDHTKRYVRQDDPKEFLQFPRCSDPNPPILLFGAVPLSPHGRTDRAHVPYYSKIASEDFYRRFVEAVGAKYSFSAAITNKRAVIAPPYGERERRHFI